MITTRTRVLSILATVAMLVSMFACFVIPASAGKAEMTDAEKITAWQQVILSLDLVDTTAMKEDVPKSYWAWYSASKNKTVASPNNWWVGEGEDDRVATVADLETAVLTEIAPNVGFPGDETKTLHWAAFSWDGSDKYPRYVYHEFYEQASYGAGADGKIHWSITAPADWLEMVAVSTYDATNNPTPETFEGEVFHLTKNIEFGKTEMAPLSPGEGSITDPTSGTVTTYTKYMDNSLTSPFNGTIEGHGFGFNDIKVVGNAPTTDKNASFGLIAKLGPKAYINDFGVNSGTIAAGSTSKAKGLYISTFGDPVNDFQGGFKSGAPSAVQTPGVRLNKVWSGASIDASGGTATSKYAAGILMLARDSQVMINGAYFTGSLVSKSGTAGLFYDVKGGEGVYNSLSATKSTVGAAVVLQNTSGIYGAVINTYSVSETDNVLDKTCSTVLTRSNGFVSSEAEGAYKINNSQVANAKYYVYSKTPQKGMYEGGALESVYYTWTKDALGNDVIRPNGNETNRIVKATVNGTTPIYLNLNEEYDNAKIAEFAGIDPLTVDAITIDDKGVAAEGKVKVTADGAAITIAVDLVKKVRVVLEKYEDLNPIYFTADEQLTAFRNEAADADTEGEANTLLGKEQAMKESLVVFTDYDNRVAGVRDIPAFKDYDLYNEYQPENANWLIVDVTDWLKMDEFANTQTKAGDYFANTTFHLVDDVDLAIDLDDDGEPDQMLPLGINTANKMTFVGTIDGHGYGFENVRIYGSANDNMLGTAYQPTSSDKVTESIGLIGYLGNGCTIQNFGINSGTIQAGSGNNGINVSTFGNIPSGATVNFNKVWSGVNLQGAANPFTSPLAGIDSGAADCHVIVNGFTFYGKASKGVNTSYNFLYGIMGGVSVGPGEDSSFANIITYPTTQADTNTYLFGGGLADLSAYDISNVYGIKKADNTKEAVGFEYDYRVGVGSKASDSNPTPYAGNATPNVLVKEMTAEEAAYELNTEKNNGVYFKLAEDGGIRPTGTAAEHMIAYTLNIDNNGSVNTTTGYMNSGNALDLITKFELDGANSVEVKVNGEAKDAVDGKYNVNGDLVITAAYDSVGVLADQLTDLLDLYEGLDTKYFKAEDELDSGKIGLATFVAQAETALAAEDAALLEAAIAAHDNIVAEISGNYTKVPAYKDHAIYEAYQPANANWLIVDLADWLAMDDFANTRTAAGDYFANTTFHLVKDVDLTTDLNADGEPDLTLPLGIKTTKKMTFVGTIDGHGYGFENVKIYGAANDNMLGTAYQPTSNDKVTESIGLIGYLGNGCTIQNFGINSGTIQAGSGNGGINVSTFGNIPSGATVNFNKVWSGVNLKGAANPFTSPLAGIDSGADDCHVIVNGFTFYGDASKGVNNSYNFLYGIMGGVSVGPGEDSSFANIITYPTTQADTNTYLFGGGLADLSAYDISNVYGIKKADKTEEAVGFEYDYRVGTGSKASDTNPTPYAGNSTPNVWVKEMTALEAAYELNTEKNDGVYFKLAEDGGIRPTGTATDKIVKVNVTGVEGVEEIYINTNVTYSNADLLDMLGITGQTIAGVTPTNGTYTEEGLTVTADDAIVVTLDECTHANLPDFEYASKGKHSATCPDCGEVITEACTEGTWLANDTEDAYGHKTNCTVCGKEFTETCKPETKYSTNCKEGGVIDFDCEVHTDITIPGQQDHNWKGWAADPENENKQINECTNEGCLVKQVRIIENVTGTDLALKLHHEGDVTINMPTELISATLTFELPAGYSIVKINGEEYTQNTYAAQGDADVVVTIKAAVNAVGGEFKVTMSEEVFPESYEAYDGTKVATINIGFEKKEFDANGSGDITLGDALAALYVCADKELPETINMANVDSNTNGVVDVEEVYAIVEEWLDITITKLAAAQ